MTVLMFKGVNMRLRLLVDLLVYFIVRLAICFVQALPIETCQRLARVLAVLAHDVLRVRRGVVDENLRHAFPEWTPQQRSEVARNMWEHLLLLVCEVAQVPRKIRDTNWYRYVKLNNIDPMVVTLLQARPKVVLTGHFGNFEVGGFMCALLGFPTYTVVRPLDNPYLDRFLTRFRELAGQRILPKRGSAAQVQEVLDANGTLGLLGDQAAGKKGCRAEFFNRQAYCHKAIALFALSNKAPVMVTTTCRGRRPLQFEITMVGQFDPEQKEHNLTTVQDVTQWYCRLLEKDIRRAPHQYWWVHRLWKEVVRKTQPRRKRQSDRVRKPAADTAESVSPTVQIPGPPQQRDHRKTA
jgi:KDO2-lipid IV(A) lauroyltransferase